MLSRNYHYRDQIILLKTKSRRTDGCTTMHMHKYIGIFRHINHYKFCRVRQQTQGDQSTHGHDFVSLYIIVLVKNWTEHKYMSSELITNLKAMSNYLPKGAMEI